MQQPWSIPTDAQHSWTPPLPTDLSLTVGRLQRGSADPHHRVVGGALWRTMRTSVGTATLHVRRAGAGFLASAWGEAAQDAVALAPGLLGADDDLIGFAPRHPLVDQAHARFRGLRIGRTGDVLGALIASVLEQRVTGSEAVFAARMLARELGTTAPGPAPEGMCAPPEPSAWITAPASLWHRAGVDPRRAQMIRAAAQRSSALVRLAERPPAEADAALRSLPGIGIWTSAEIRQRAFGDADALSVGDFHLAAMVGHALEGRAFNDEQLVTSLAPWRPHRYRVVRLLNAAGWETAPRRGPRRSRTSRML